MKEEEEEIIGIESGSGLASETQAYEMEFIKTFKSLPVLWDPKHPDYTNKYRRGVANESLLQIIKKWDNTANTITVRRKINVLRSTYRKDLRRHIKSKVIGPDGKEIYEYYPKSWKYYALKFLGGKDEEIERIKNCNFIEINLDDTNLEDEASEESGNESSSQTDALQTHTEDNITTNQSYINKQRNKAKRAKLDDIQDYISNNSAFDEELQAISANVAFKLKRMCPEQRCHAELLINKVLISGLRNSLTDDTDLTEVYK